MVSFRRQHWGFTLVELMVTITIAAILLTIGVPSLTSFFDRQKVVAAAEEAYSSMQLAKGEALSRSKNIYINVEDGINTWSYGFSTSSDCDSTETDLSESSACVLEVGGNADLMHWDNDAHEGVRLTTYLGSSTAEGTTKFDYTRGMHEKKSDQTGIVRTFVFSYKTLKLAVVINKVGRVRICSPDGSIGGYSAC
ncbi:MAG: hypothetical protein RL336_1854 [Pseudomonadota bacterium]